MRHMMVGRTATAAVLVGLSVAGMASAAINVETVPVGNLGNAADPLTGYGRVNYAYNIGKYEVTAGQYTAFLNAVAKTDPNGLYNSFMWSVVDGCKIQRVGSAGSYSYSVAPDYADRPVNYVNFWDACRFANWLQNGQPTGPQGPGATETGTYTLTPSGIANNTITRNATWQWAVTSEDEWYKAAYHKNDGATANYYLYPTSSDTAPGRNLADASGNNANWYYFYGTYPLDNGHYTTLAGQFHHSASPYGTFDQAGNVWEWNEAVINDSSGSNRDLRGGAFDASTGNMPANVRYFSTKPVNEIGATGFRVVQFPEPASVTTAAFISMAMLGRRTAAK